MATKQNIRLTFSVATHPQAKERARRAPTGIWYTPARTKKAEQEIAMAFIIAKATAFIAPMFPLTGAVKMTIDCRIKTKNKRLIGKWKPTRCDCDNIAKTVCDALNGHAYVDDGQVARLEVSKRFWHEDNITISIEELKNEHD